MLTSEATQARETEDMGSLQISISDLKVGPFSVFGPAGEGDLAVGPSVHVHGEVKQIQRLGNAGNPVYVLTFDGGNLVLPCRVIDEVHIWETGTR